MYLRDLQKGTYISWIELFSQSLPNMYCILLWIVWIVRLTLIMIEITMNGQNKAFGLSIKPIHIWHTYSLVSAKMQIYLRFSVLMNILLSNEYDLWNKINSSKGLNPVRIEILFKIWSSEIHFKLKFCWVMILKWTKFRQSVT